MSHIEKLQSLLTASADHIDEYGHHQFDMWEGDACCIMGAPRMISKESSYSHVARTVLAHIGYDERWNDQPDRTKEEVVVALNESATQITPELMKEVYGDHWHEILTFISQVDDWNQQDYDRIAVENHENEYPYEHVDDREYLNAMVAFMATIMTSGMTGNSIPYKKYFDTTYQQEWEK